MQITAEAAAKYPALKELVDIYSHRQETTVFLEDKIHKDLTIVEARPNKLIWEFNVQEAHCNQLGNIHGGCVATIIDVCSSFALATWEGIQCIVFYAFFPCLFLCSLILRLQ